MEKGLETLKKTTCFSDSRGVTLIELIVVMAIISIISVGSMLGMGVLGYGSAKSVTGRIKSLADYVRIENMTRSEQYYLVIYNKDNSYFVCIQSRENDGSIVDVRTERLDLRQGSIYYQDTDDNRYLISSEAVDDVEVRDKLMIEYIKDTGGLRKGLTVKPVKFIEVVYNRGSYRLYFVEATGKTYVE